MGVCMKEKDRLVTLLLVIAGDSNIPKSTRKYADDCAESICRDVTQESVMAVQHCLYEILERSFGYKEEIKEANNYLKKILKEKRRNARREFSDKTPNEIKEEAREIIKDFEMKWKNWGGTSSSNIEDFFFDMGYIEESVDYSFEAECIVGHGIEAWLKSKLDIEDYLLRYE
jgi:hypothetical protein